MSDSALVVGYALIGLVAVTMAAAAILRLWTAWLDLRRLQTGRCSARARGGARFELANLRERVRRLEAIANGGDL